ncbi:hypothetical protein SDRG_10548 [Saprolegnia diclina VS20]|uniref:FIST C-domain domain-containing protein n=1 Tax=Saprolegnia diclina (strain VS20) TaxID=1156394 RepID=T0Q1N4_SAPDV|nr:hypothetical protein SDRG_10548 [Saprolegnia diclina VS20]EQC31759.1 hypothetical protein SDRG_10548 [Saprolegnia diclina VS20]|eukprot:XP_008614766.1 hypothetical protein SDRG_10548 [Saprolegnia diclina VS20]
MAFSRSPTSLKMTKHQAGSALKGGRGKKAKDEAAKKPQYSVPEEVIPFIFQYLSWRDGYRAGRVSRAWHEAHASILLPTSPMQVGLHWRASTYTGESWDDILSEFAPDDTCFASQYAPQLAMLTVSGLPHALRRPTGWNKLFHVIQERKLLPRACTIICMYSDFGIMASTAAGGHYDLSELESSAIDDMAVNITVGYFPNTTLQVLEPTKHEIRDGLLTPALSPSTNSILVYSTNGAQCDHLVRLMATVHTSANIVGTILPFTDRCVPIAVRRISPAGPSISHPTHLCVAFDGRVASAPFVSLGFKTISPILQCEHMQTRRHPYFKVLHTFESVAVAASPTSPAMSVAPIQLLNSVAEASGNVYLFKAETEAEIAAFIAAPHAVHLDRTVCIYDKQHGIVFSQADAESGAAPWCEGMFGVFCVQDAVAGQSDLAHALALAKAAASGATVLGGLTYPCAARGEGFYGENDVEAHTFASVFPDTPLAGVISGGEIGPLAMPGGSLSPDRKIDMQSYTTCGALFYLRP